MGSVKPMHVEVAYARADQQVIISLELSQGATVESAISASGLLTRFPEIDLSHQQVGVFGERVDLQHPLQAGDRVEIYRALVCDPKTARRRRAVQHRKSKHLR